MYEIQWPLIEQALKKISSIAEETTDSKIAIQQIKDAIYGNGSIGIKEQLTEIRLELKNKVSKKDCSFVHKEIKTKKKSKIEWFKAAVPWIIAIAGIAAAYFKT